MTTTHQPVARERRTPAENSTRWFVIAFAIVEAALLAWALLSGHIG